MAPRTPDFICIGSAKSGTTWLYQVLSECAGYWMPPLSEIRYFGGKDIGTRDEPHLSLAEAYPCIEKSELEWIRAYVKGEPKDDSWYISLFSEAGDRTTGDISPSYAVLPPRFIQRAKQVVPDAHVIMIIRNPVDRAISQALHLARKDIFGGNAARFAASELAAQLGISGDRKQRHLALMERYHIPWRSRADLEMILDTHNKASGDNATLDGLLGQSPARVSADALRTHLNDPGVLRRNRQSETITNWRSVFGTQMHVFRFNELVVDPARFLEAVTMRLGRVATRTADPAAVRKRFNIGFYGAVDGLEEIRAELKSQYADEIAQLDDLAAQQ